MSEREGGRREGKEEISPAGFEAGEGKECAAPIVLNLGKRQPCEALQGDLATQSLDFLREAM